MPKPLTLTARALLFDMDGTLVDSTAVSERIWRAWSAKAGVDPEAVLAYSHGRRTLDTTRRFTANEDGAVQAYHSIEAQEIAAEDGVIRSTAPRSCWTASPLIAGRS